MDKKIIQTASDVLGITLEEAQRYSKPIPDINAMYFWKPVRGGKAMIINENGEKLVAASAISFDKHLQAFSDGRRN